MTHSLRVHIITTGVLGIIANASTQSLRDTQPPHRRRHRYLSELRKSRGVLQDIAREALPVMMCALPDPGTIGDLIHLEWLSWRDALLERAFALGYAVGQLWRVNRGAKTWSGIAYTVAPYPHFACPVTGHLHGHNWRPPSNGKTVLLTRGWVSQREPEREFPFVPVPWWFSEDPLTSTRKH